MKATIVFLLLSFSIQHYALTSISTLRMHLLSGVQKCIGQDFDEGIYFDGIVCVLILMCCFMDDTVIFFNLVIIQSFTSFIYWSVYLFLYLLFIYLLLLI